LTSPRHSGPCGEDLSRPELLGTTPLLFGPLLSGPLLSGPLLSGLMPTEHLALHLATA